MNIGNVTENVFIKIASFLSPIDLYHVEKSGLMLDMDENGHSYTVHCAFEQIKHFKQSYQKTGSYVKIVRDLMLRLGKQLNSLDVTDDHGQCLLNNAHFQDQDFIQRFCEQCPNLTTFSARTWHDTDYTTFVQKYMDMVPRLRFTYLCLTIDTNEVDFTSNLRQVVQKCHDLIHIKINFHMTSDDLIGFDGMPNNENVLDRFLNEIEDSLANKLSITKITLSTFVSMKSRQFLKLLEQLPNLRVIKFVGNDDKYRVVITDNHHRLHLIKQLERTNYPKYYQDGNHSSSFFHHLGIDVQLKKLTIYTYSDDVPSSMSSDVNHLEISNRDPRFLSLISKNGPFINLQKLSINYKSYSGGKVKSRSTILFNRYGRLVNVLRIIVSFEQDYEPLTELLEYVRDHCPNIRKLILAFDIDAHFGPASKQPYPISRSDYELFLNIPCDVHQLTMTADPQCGCDKGSFTYTIHSVPIFMFD